MAFANKTKRAAKLSERNPTFEEDCTGETRYSMIEWGNASLHQDSVLQPNITLGTRSPPRGLGPKESGDTGIDTVFLLWCSGLIIAGTTGIAVALKRICKKKPRSHKHHNSGDDSDGDQLKAPECNMQCKCCRKIFELKKAGHPDHAQDRSEMQKLSHSNE